MNKIISERDRLDFAESVAQADNDSRTTGVFLLLLAPRNDGYIQETVLTVGKLPIGPVMNRILKQSYAKLMSHNDNNREWLQ